MATADSIRFLASQLTGLGDRARQDTQQATSNMLAKKYQQLAESKYANEQKLQGQQTAVGALDQLATIKATQMMDEAGDKDVTHLPIYKEKAKVFIISDPKNAKLASSLPPELLGAKVPISTLMFKSQAEPQTLQKTPFDLLRNRKQMGMGGTSPLIQNLGLDKSTQDLATLYGGRQ